MKIAGLLELLDSDAIAIADGGPGERGHGPAGPKRTLPAVALPAEPSDGGWIPANVLLLCARGESAAASGGRGRRS